VAEEEVRAPGEVVDRVAKEAKGAMVVEVVRRQWCHGGQTLLPLPKRQL
jgi:hypothetical protein